ncbi:MAG: polysaccharide biosynthesis protein, partial [Longimicrobiales bacterium]|nr:polysaccharide biosynthesis protein [Longimicrobiales bacterium]
MKEFEGFVPDLGRMTSGSRVLVIGGAGTIGSASLRALLRGRAKAISVVDTNENGLAELTRDIRNREWAAPLPDLEFVPLDYGGRIMERYLDERDFDFVLNFAALKHVRSEKNAWSSLRLLHVNVLSLMALIRALDRGDSGPGRLFSVSTDKAADPANLMGASKRIMEAVLLERKLGVPDAA